MQQQEKRAPSVRSVAVPKLAVRALFDSNARRPGTSSMAHGELFALPSSSGSRCCSKVPCLRRWSGLVRSSIRFGPGHGTSGSQKHSPPTKPARGTGDYDHEVPAIELLGRSYRAIPRIGAAKSDRSRRDGKDLGTLLEACAW